MFANHLDKNVTTSDAKKVASRNGFGEGLVEAGLRDKQVVALSADLTESTRVLPFAEAFPNRFIQTGIAEQNMASVASGMAAMGKIPFISSYAMFSPGRNWEQIRSTIAYNNTNVKIVGAHAGISVGSDGATHQALEDIALMRVIPNMVVINPCDAIEARKATLVAAKYEGPVYIRTGRSETPVVTTEDSPFVLGQAELFYERSFEGEKSLAIISTGILINNALLAAIELEKRGIPTSVFNMATIKPLDTNTLDNISNNFHSIVTVEEHQTFGGLGGAVSEYLSTVKPMKVIRVGVIDQFGQSGEPEELLKHYGLDVDSIVRAGILSLQ